MQLALGTVQFGVRYGVAGRGSVVPEPEVRAILARAASLGISLLDTAAAYGDVEARLATLAAGREFRVVTKLPAVPASIAGRELEEWVTARLGDSKRRLGVLLDAVLFHRASDLLGAEGDRLWECSWRYAAENGFRLGVSAYDLKSVHEARRRYPIALAQVPGNALDQRLRDSADLISLDVEIHVRSVFLQGLLLMPEARACERVPLASEALAKWHLWCQSRELDPLAAALGIAKGLPGVRYCVVGVDRLEHLDAIALAWSRVSALTADELSTSDPNVIDPRLWPQTS